MPKSARDSQRNEKERKPFCTCLQKNALVTSEGGCLRGKRAVVSSGARRICRAATTTAPITSVAWVKLDPSDWRRGRMTLRLLVCSTRHQVLRSLSHTSGGANTDAVYWSVRTGDLSGKATVTRRGAGVRHRFPCNTPPYLWSRQV